MLSRRLPPLAAAALIGLLASMLVVSPAQAEEGAGPESQQTPVAPPAEVEPTTTTEVALLPVSAPSDYTDGPAVPEAAGDAQQQELVGEPLASEPDTETVEAPATAGAARVELNSDIAVVGVTWGSEQSAPESVELRSLIAGTWTEWYELEIDEQPGGGESAPEGLEALGPPRGASEPMSVTGADAVEVIARYRDAEPAGGLALSVIDPRGGDPVENALDVDGGSVLDSATEIPATAMASPSSVYETGSHLGLRINTRSAWGADESLRGGWVSPNTRYRGAVVHHTAHGGPNNYTQDQVPGLIRSFYRYHVSNNFGDIGYQLLVDRFGGVWEGRYGSLTRSLVGAQAYGANYETFGIAVIGTWQSELPPAAAQNSTAKAIAWIFDSYGITSAHGGIRVPGIDGLGRTVPVISGHREIGGTTCPGDALFARLPALANQVGGYLSPPLTGNTIRYEGANRYDTAAKTALATHPDGAATVYITNGANYPDALAGGPAASIDDAPLLLVESNRIPAEIQNALVQLSPSSIVILGGTGVVSSAVESQLRNLGATTVRYGGGNRYGTAAQVGLAKFPDADTVYLASGENFPDALAAVPIAGRDGVPLLLTEPGRLPSETENALRQMRPSRIVILGGTGAVSSAVESRAVAVSGAVSVRYAGADRFDTSAQIALSKYTGATDTVYIATALDFPDALAGGPAAQGDAAPLLLVEPADVPMATRTALVTLQPKRIVILGGPGAVSKANERRLDGYIIDE